MGKRQGGKGGSNSKRQRCHALVEPGMYGLYVTCPKFKEVAAAKEMRVILQEAIEKHYPKAEEQVAAEEEAKKAEADKAAEAVVDIEDEIAKEIAEMKKNDDRSKQGRNNKDLVMREVQLGVESLTFFKLRQPVVPSAIALKMCQDLKDSGIKHGRFIQKITPVDKSCNATDIEFKKLLSAIVSQYAEEHGNEVFETYNVNLVKRNFDTISRDDFMEMIQAEMDRQFGEGKTNLRYKEANTLINVYCYKNNIGASCVSQSAYTDLSKFNLQQMFLVQEPKDEASRVDKQEQPEQQQEPVAVAVDQPNEEEQLQEVQQQQPPV